MRIEELDYDLPPELIAQLPREPRDASRLLVVDRAAGALAHREFRHIRECLRAGDLLVLNDTRVVPARFFARRASGGRVEGLFLHLEDAAAPAGSWRALLKPSQRLHAGEALQLLDRAGCPLPRTLHLAARHERGEWTVTPAPPTDALELLDLVGLTPLPPYIRRAAGADPAADAARYQTVYAAQPGAVAAPTAGLHFTPALLDELAAAGVQRTSVTLHVGPGTFSPIDVIDLAGHRMHAEWFSIAAPAVHSILATRAAGGRVVAVGTTAARVLESVASRAPHLAPQSGWTDIFIYPPYRFGLVDALLTNFHLPRSTLLAMVMAFAGADLIRSAYAAAIAERYRFYSYGDAMFIT